MKRQEILNGVREAAEEHLGWQGVLRDEMRLVEDLELDSLRLFTFAAELESRFRIYLDEGDEKSVTTVGELVDLLEGKIAGPKSL